VNTGVEFSAGLKLQRLTMPYIMPLPNPKPGGAKGGTRTIVTGGGGDGGGGGMFSASSPGAGVGRGPTPLNRAWKGKPDATPGIPPAACPSSAPSLGPAAAAVLAPRPAPGLCGMMRNTPRPNSPRVLVKKAPPAPAYTVTLRQSAVLATALFLTAPPSRSGAS
jgi:hypothetical protein